MKRIGEVMRPKRDMTREERDTLQHVVEIARAWQRGELPLCSVRTQCSGYERVQAMRFAELGSDGKQAIMALVDALLAEDTASVETNHGRIRRDDLHEDEAKRMTNWRGDRVLVWPMFTMNGVPHYPQVHLEPGEKRRKREEAMMDSYKKYRDTRKGRA